MRVVFLTEGEAPPTAVVELLSHSSMDVEGRELDAFFAELDMGFPIPDLLVGVGGEHLVRALRQHETTACLPVFRWGSTATVPPGWDGSVVRWNDSRLSDVALWLDRLAPFPSIAEPDEAERREHLFLRFLATRGSASLADAKVFGVKGPHAALRRWQERGWCHGAVQHLQATPGLLDVVGRERLKIEERLPLPAASTASAVHPSQDVPAVATPAVRTNPSARSDTFERTLTARLAWVVILVLLALVVFLFERAGGVDWLQGLDGSLAHSVEPAGLESADPEVRQPVPVTQEPAVLAAGAQVSLPELFLDGRLVRPMLDLPAAIAGRVSWSVASGSLVQKGETVGFLNQVAGVDHTARLQELRAEMDSELALQQREAEAEWQQSVEKARSDVQLHHAEVQRLQRRLPELQQNYDHARALAEEGVLSFREVRPEWEALVAVEEELESAGAEETHAQASLFALQEQGSPDLSTKPTWASQVRALDVQLEEAQANLVQIPIVAPGHGELDFQVEAGRNCHPGEVVALLTPQNGGHIEAVLATPDWHAAYLSGGARLRRPERSSWMPTRVLSAVSEPDGLTHLRLRLPVGWLDDALALADADRELLELRITPPAPPSIVSAQDDQPLRASPVESTQ
ncbi:MAG: HlyD family secretion protein [Planctomycetota bacterium]